ncbi:6-phospho-3-hexuloisomerase [Lachnospiraceae bacterium PAL113]|uniref:6-phospho-3-hexuloisomerase n=2 Tax=Aequitasia blattaphilus TaxID=2949332 RepID=A0ABT1EAQ3_9FIRM|nr:6-phospho-3-hexuloisomerase [Aequitasia blattaphilus]MCP1102699.1 6-phospho-3-hexuloisomerase [Aequitasia blattaphilus]MCR8615339.1 6-phospho-3-hexuloisomerase [Aequitasia blattaphilus]
MRESKVLIEIVEEIARYTRQIDELEMLKMVELIQNASKIFVVGAGRSGFCARAFSNRLMHLGKQTFFVGEPTTPSIGEGDLLIIGSGSGETESLKVMAEKAARIGADVATVTIFPEATIGKLAKAAICIPGGTPKSERKDSVKSVQPMGNLFEQLSWIVYDGLIKMLMKEDNILEDEMFKRHANLE